MHERYHFRLLATLSMTKSQIASIVFLNLSFIIEFGYAAEWISFSNPETVLGLSLGLILLSMSLNVKTIRKMGMPKKERQASLKLLVITGFYTLLVYAFQIPQAIFP